MLSPITQRKQSDMTESDDMDDWVASTTAMAIFGANSNTALTSPDLIRAAGCRAPQYIKLIETIQRGFPRTRRLTTLEVSQYWEVRHHFSVDNDLALLDQRIITPMPIGMPTDWCSMMLITAKKNGKPRRTIDYQHLNSQCKWETHHTGSPFHCLWFARTCGLQGPAQHFCMRGVYSPTYSLLSSFPCSSGGPLVGLTIRCWVTEVSSFPRNLWFRKVILPDPSTLIQY